MTILKFHINQLKYKVAGFRKQKIVKMRQGQSVMKREVIFKCPP